MTKKMGPDASHAWILHGPTERGDVEGQIAVNAAEARAAAFAARVLSAQECPNDLKEWGRAHGIPTFAEYTWQAGFIAGMRFFELQRQEIACPQGDEK